MYIPVSANLFGKIHDEFQQIIRHIHCRHTVQLVNEEKTNTAVRQATGIAVSLGWSHMRYDSPINSNIEMLTYQQE